MNSDRCQNIAGFSLVELSVALLVFLIGILGVLQLFTASVKTNERNRDITITASLAQSKVDELLSQSFAALPINMGSVQTNPFTDPGDTTATAGFVDYFKTDLTAGTSADCYYIREWQIQDVLTGAEAAPANVKRITVTVVAKNTFFRNSLPNTTIIAFKSKEL